MNRSLKLWIYTLLTPLLLWLAWSPRPFGILMLVAFIPLLYVEDKISRRYAHPRKRVLLHGFIAFLVWNILCTWWIWYASEGGAIAAIILNSLLMLIPWSFFHYIKRKISRPAGYMALILGWMAFELFHLNWQGTWPWLNIGNSLAALPWLVQWYEITGTMGGTFWILSVNILIFDAFLLRSERHLTRRKENRVSLLVVALLGPIAGSLLMYAGTHARLSHVPPQKFNAVIVQPNIEPYEEKFSQPVEDQMKKMIALSDSGADAQTKMIIWPETSIVQDMDEEHIPTYNSYRMLSTYLKRHPDMVCISGINSFAIYPSLEKASETVRIDSVQTGNKPDGNPLFGVKYYDLFNTAMILNARDSFGLYHKSRLVPGVEKMPYPKALGFLKYLAIDMGGSLGSVGSQAESEVFDVSDSIRAAPVICYESIFGEYVASFVDRGANIITIITNDGWWKNTDGHRQHLDYARLRAIETRCMVLRSANTGISAVINPLGEVLKRRDWDQATIIKTPFILNNRKTIYVQFGDYLGRIAAGLCLLLWIWSFIKKKKRSEAIPETVLQPEENI